MLHSDMRAQNLSTYTSSTVSALWILLSDVTLIIIGCIYHPPSASIKWTLEYMRDTLHRLTSLHKTSRILITGDFNRPPPDNLLEQHSLCNMNCSIRQDATLDMILTGIKDYRNAEKPILQTTTGASCSTGKCGGSTSTTP